MRFIAQRLAAVLAVLCCGLLAGAAIDASQNAPRAQFDNLEEQFKYGSVGIESEEGFPYWLWQALPRVFADKLPRPGGYDSFGFVWEPGHELPVGFSTADLFGGPRIAVNCAFCHTSAYRLDPAGPRTLVTAGPGNLVNPQAYVRFLHTVADDPRFNAGELLKAIDGLTNLSWMRRMQYRMLLIPGTRRALQRQKKAIRVDGSQSRLGRRAYRSVQSDQVPPAETADRHEHRQRRHDAAVEHERAHGDSLGRADDVVS